MLQMKEKLDAYKITDEESKKISIVKVWFTIMVVFIHSNNKLNFASGNFDTPAWLEVLKYFISECISRCAVPGFFLISAILLYKKSFKWKENIKKKIKQIMIPYLIFNTFWILFYVVVQHIPVLSNYFSNPDTIVADWSIIDWLEAYLGFQDNYPICYPLWFLRALFVLNILAICNYSEP